MESSTPSSHIGDPLRELHKMVSRFLPESGVLVVASVF